MRASARERHAAETSKEREAQLQLMRTRLRNRLAAETAEEREAVRECPSCILPVCEPFDDTLFIYSSHAYFSLLKSLEKLKAVSSTAS